MRTKENYAPHLAVALGLTLAILAAFQLYIWREPQRIQAVESSDRLAALTAGRVLYEKNCTACHGKNGEGDVGPALNSRELLKTTIDETLFNLIRTGVPGTVMPAWGQAFGGPLTDEEARQLVTFLRAWESTAPEITPKAFVPDPVRGATIFASTCYLCHGLDGRGGRAPALNDPARLSQFDDKWLRETIVRGRPAKGMPTWGTVLSPKQIDDLVALLAAWRHGETVNPNTQVGDYLQAAQFALSRGDGSNAQFYLQEALISALPRQAVSIRAAIVLIVDGDLHGASNAVNQMLTEALAGDPAKGRELYVAKCQKCHGENGGGNSGPALVKNQFVQQQDDQQLKVFILAGRPNTLMPSWDGLLSNAEIAHIIALLRQWQK